MFFSGVPDPGSIFIILLMYCLVVAVTLKYGSRLLSPVAGSGRMPRRLRLLWPFAFLALLLAALCGIGIGLAFGSRAGSAAISIVYLMLISMLGFFLLYPKEHRFSTPLERIGRPALLGLLSILFAAGALYGFLHMHFR